MHFKQISWPASGKQRKGKVQKVINKILRKLRIGWALEPALDTKKDMVSKQQIVNIQHLLSHVLESEIEGDILELGCHTGSTATVISSILEVKGATKMFHAYDRFDFEEGGQNLRQQLEQHFVELGLKMPAIHEGDVFELIPGDMPEKVAFVHIDLGVGTNTAAHQNVVLHVLKHVYPRMPKGAIGLLMDYHDPEMTIDGYNPNPGMTLSAQTFFSDKPEEVYTLYGGPYSHGYFRKS